MNTLKLRGEDPLRALDVEVTPASDDSYVDIAVANRHGQIANVTLKLDRMGSLVVHCEDWTNPATPGARDASCPVHNEVIVPAALDARPLTQE